MSNTLHLFTGKFFCRGFTTSSNRSLSYRSRNSQLEIDEVGNFVQESDRLIPYDRGQLFIHKIFGYRGILICFMDCKVYTRKSENPKQTMEIIPYYQVLIESDDWNEMNFQYNLTTCLHSNGIGEQKNLAEYNGIDIVSHDEILPYKQCEKNNSSPINNEYYSYFFNRKDDNAHKREENLTSDTALQQEPSACNATFPQAVYKQITEQIEVHVIPFYLGFNLKRGYNFHLWRCLFRVSNLEKRAIEITGRKLQTSSMIGEYFCTDLAGENGLLTKRKRLTPTKSITQFSSHFEMPCQRGNKLWGYFITEDDEERSIKATIPTISLEEHVLVSQKKSKQLIN